MKVALGAQWVRPCSPLLSTLPPSLSPIRLNWQGKFQPGPWQNGHEFLMGGCPELRSILMGIGYISKTVCTAACLTNINKTGWSWREEKQIYSGDMKEKGGRNIFCVHNPLLGTSHRSFTFNPFNWPASPREWVQGRYHCPSIREEKNEYSASEMQAIYLKSHSL